MAATDTEKDGTKQTTGVRSVSYAIAILRLAAVTDHPLGVTEIARTVGMSASSCFNILKTLTTERFLAFNPKTKKYSLGSGAIELSSKTDGAERVLANYRSRLLDLATSLNVVVGFWEVRNERLVLASVMESNAAFRIQMVAGQRLPLSAGAMGRVVAAELGLRGDALQTHLELTQWHRPPRPATYRREVARSATVGWAADVGQFIGGVATVASVVAAAPRDPRYCITASGFVGQLDATEIERIGDATHRIASEIQRDWFNRTD